ncbi:MAG: hypothetical protein ACRYFS_11925 [Janthinobacterium lividum]
MNLEDALQDQEAQVDELLKSAARYMSALKSWKKACQTGHLGNRGKSAALVAELVSPLNEAAAQAAESWQFDARAYLESADWRTELRAAAEKLGLRVLDEGDTLISSPLIVRSVPGRSALALGKTLWPNIHPRIAAAELKRLRDRATAGNSQEFADSLFAACRHLTADVPAPFARFKDIYALYTLTPGWKKDNPEAAFGQAIYALHRSGLSVTRAGRKFEFEYPSGNVKERDVFTVLSEDGRPIRYWGVQFR